MTNKIYTMRMPTVTEYKKLVEITEGDDNLMHWKECATLLDDPSNLFGIQKSGTHCPVMGCGGSMINGIIPMDERGQHVGFRPVVTAINKSGLEIGEIVSIGTLFMNDVPVWMELSDTCKVVSYIPGAKLEMGPSAPDIHLQVKGIYIGNDTFIADRVMLVNISANDIRENIVLPTTEQTREVLVPHPVVSLNEVYESKRDIFWFWCNACGEINTPGKPALENGNVEDMPPEIQETYKTFWHDGYEQACYVVQWNLQHGIALNTIFDAEYLEQVIAKAPAAKEMKLGEELTEMFLHYTVQKTAERIAESVPQGIVLCGKNKDTSEGDEIMVFLPRQTLTTQKELSDLSQKLDGEIYDYFEKFFLELITNLTIVNGLLSKKLNAMLKGTPLKAEPSDDVVFNRGFDAGYRSAAMAIMVYLDISTDPKIYLEQKAPELI